MDEAEKYQQRLQAISVKRRQQEEQERAKREMEDEKLRQQQLKRKSLRDQWLMEGPSSPTSESPCSPTSGSPRSPLWGSQAQELEDKLQTESQRLVEEGEKLKEQMEDGQTEAVAEAKAEAAQGVILENGQDAASGAVEAGVVTNLTPLLEGAAELTNGRGEGEGEAATRNAVGEDGRPSTNGPTGDLDGAVTMTFLGFQEAEPGQVPNGDGGPEEEEEGAVVMRAERVIITDEGDEVPDAQGKEDDLSPPAVEGESGAPQPSSESTEEAGETEAAKPEASPEASAELEKGEDGEGTVAVSAEAGTETGGGEGEGNVEANGDVDGETKGDGEGEIKGDVGTNGDGEGEIKGDVGTNGDGDGEIKGDGETDGDGEIKGEAQQVEEAPISDLQSPAAVLDGAVASVPVYSEALPLLTPRPDVEGEAAQQTGEGGVEGNQEKGEEEASVAEAIAALPGQFQEVSLAEPRTEPGENSASQAAKELEPLLATSKAPTTNTSAQADPAAAAQETLLPTRAQGEPKQKSCQCCSVM